MVRRAGLAAVVTGLALAPGWAGAATIALQTPVDLAITDTDGLSAASPDQSLTYTIVATNNGPNPVTGAYVLVVGGDLTGVSWTCAGAGGGSCTGSGSVDISDTAVDLPVGGSVTYTLTGTVSASPRNIQNVAFIAPPADFGDPVPGNNWAVDDDTLLCHGETVVVADGRWFSDTIAGGATRWFGATLKNDLSGDSYSLEIQGPTEAGAPPGTLDVFAGDEGCVVTNPLSTTDTSAVEPGAPITSRRVSFNAEGMEPFFRVRLVNPSGTPAPFRLAIADTTLYSPAWSTAGSFDTYYSFLNTTGSERHVLFNIIDDAGAGEGSVAPILIPAGQTVTTNTAALGVPRGRTGTARLTHDGPPGAILAEAAIASFKLSPAYVQPVKFQSVREAR